MAQPVTLVTRDATLDNLSVGDYLEMCEELRPIDPKTGNRLSIDKFIARIGSQWSKPLWHQVIGGEKLPNRSQRNELRAAMGLPLLPPTVADATAQASPDAAVWMVGDGVPEHVIMVGSEPVTLHVNSGVSVVAPQAHVTRVTGRQIQRKRYTRPCVSEAQNRRFLALPVRSWGDVIEAGLTVWENPEFREFMHQHYVDELDQAVVEMKRTEKATW